MSAARADRLRPVYCTEAQRAIWNRPVLIKGLRPLQTGCLLANARDVPEAANRLPRIENVCVPWHYLCIPRVLSKTGILDDFVATAIGPLGADIDDAHLVGSGTEGWDAPSIDDLNGFGRESFDSTGVHETNEGDLEPAESTTPRTATFGRCLGGSLSGVSLIWISEGSMRPVTTLDSLARSPEDLERQSADPPETARTEDNRGAPDRRR